MIIELNKAEHHQLTDRLLANHFSDLKFIQTYQKRNSNKQLYLFDHRFCLKIFLLEFNIIRHVTKDEKNTLFENTNIFKLSSLMDSCSYSPDDIDKFARKIQDKKISPKNPVSLTSKLFFLGNPKQVFIYDSLVRTAIGLKHGKVSYARFYDRINEIILKRDFQSYVSAIEDELNSKLTDIETWSGFLHAKKIRKMRIIDRYLMFIGSKNKSLYKAK